MRRFSLLLMLGLLGLISISCDSTPDESGTVTLTGQILDAVTNNPIPVERNPVVRIQANDLFDKDKDQDIIVPVDEDGFFTVDIDITATADLVIVATANGFSSRTERVLVFAGLTVEVPRFRIADLSPEQRESGTPSNILLISQTNNVIGVIESGSQEVSRITFRVADSTGLGVQLDDQALVRFSFGQQPGGGEFIAPAEAATDNNGLVTVNLSSGTKAGVVQIVAEVDTDGGTIRSKPVSVAIHGGLPDEAHFTVGPAQFNFPGLLAAGVTDRISVIVGDKWANPVRPGTAVYFTTTHGIIEGSTQTNAQGSGSVDLISGNPFPLPLEAGGTGGVATVTASTANEDQGEITTQFPVLFSGFVVLDVQPTTAILDQTYTLRVTDQYGNPLAQGTSISAGAGGTKVKTVGDVNVTLDDTVFLNNGDGVFDQNDVLRGAGITEFIFRAVEDLTLDEAGVPTLETITISVSGPNGGLTLTLTAGGQMMTRMEGATIETLPNGHVRVQAAH